MMRIVVDVMGGDHGPGVVVEGARMALSRVPGITEICLVGDEAQIRAEIDRWGKVDSRIQILHASEVLTMRDKPVEGLRKKRDCSLARAVERVRDGKGDAIISPGNTGGLMAAATIRLRPVEHVDRPAIATVIPSARGEFVLLDAGANPDCRPLHLMQFAVMGRVYSREILGKTQPRVGILSNGTEDIKGTELTRAAAALCRKIDLQFLGFVEGHDLFNDRVDVVVTDGFVGNIVLKTCESMGKGIVHLLRREFSANWLRMAGAALARGAFRSIRRRMDPDAYGGAPLLGLKGQVIKTHGSARELAVMNAIRVATESVRHHITEIINHEVGAANALTADPAPDLAPAAIAES